MSWNRYNRLLIFVILLTAVALRFYKIGSQSLWIDEVYTFMNSSGPLSEVIFEPRTEYKTPPLYYMIEHFALQFGNGELVLRFPSVIFGSFSIILFYLVLSSLFDGKTSILGTIMMAISPFHVWYSQEARAYALLLFLSLLSIYLFLKLLKNPLNPFVAVGFIISTALSVYCHTVAISLIGFMTLYLTVTVSSEERLTWLIIFGGIVLLIVPAAYSIRAIMVNAKPVSYESLNALPIIYAFYAFASGYSLGPTLAELHMPDRVSYVVSNFQIILPIMILVFLLLALGFSKLLKQPKWIHLFIVLWFAFPIAFIFLSSMLGHGSFNVRYAIISFPAFLVIISFGIQSAKGKWMRVSFIGLVCLISTVSLVNYFFNSSYYREDIKSAGKLLTKQALANDLVICSAPYAVHGLAYYTKRNDLNIVGYPVKERSVSPSLISSDFRQTINGENRFWLFLSRTFHSDPNGHIVKYCDDRYRRVYALQSNGVELVLYNKKEITVSALVEPIKLGNRGGLTH